MDSKMFTELPHQTHVQGLPNALRTLDSILVGDTFWPICCSLMTILTIFCCVYYVYIYVYIDICSSIVKCFDGSAFSVGFCLFCW